MATKKTTVQSENKNAVANNAAEVKNEVRNGSNIKIEKEVTEDCVITMAKVKNGELYKCFIFNKKTLEQSNVFFFHTNVPGAIKSAKHYMFMLKAITKLRISQIALNKLDADKVVVA